jgi:hypothetical protein
MSGPESQKHDIGKKCEETSAEEENRKGSRGNEKDSEKDKPMVDDIVEN